MIKNLFQCLSNIISIIIIQQVFMKGLYGKWYDIKIIANTIQNTKENILIARTINSNSKCKSVKKKRITIPHFLFPQWLAYP